MMLQKIPEGIPKATTVDLILGSPWAVSGERNITRQKNRIGAHVLQDFAVGMVSPTDDFSRVSLNW